MKTKIKRNIKGKKILDGTTVSTKWFYPFRILEQAIQNFK